MTLHIYKCSTWMSWELRQRDILPSSDCLGSHGAMARGIRKRQRATETIARWYVTFRDRLTSSMTAHCSSMAGFSVEGYGNLCRTSRVSQSPSLMSGPSERTRWNSCRWWVMSTRERARRMRTEGSDDLTLCFQPCCNQAMEECWCWFESQETQARSMSLYLFEAEAQMDISSRIA